MTTVQHFLAWVREKSKKNRNSNHNSSFMSASALSVESSSVDPSLKTYVKHLDMSGYDRTLMPDGLPRSPDLMEMLQQSDMTLQEKEAFVNEVRRRAPYRASMKLPAIPREDQRQLMTFRKRHQDSPCHVYEEIPAYALDSECDIRYTDDLVSAGDYNEGLTKLDYLGSVDRDLNSAVPINHVSNGQNPLDPSIRMSNQDHQMLRNSQRNNAHQDLMKQHQDTIERHRRTVQQYREAMPTPVCTDDDPNILRSDRLYPEDVSSDSGFMSSTLKDTLRSSQHSAFSPFTPRSSEQALPTTQNTNNTDSDICAGSQSAPDCKIQMDSITSGNSNFRRLSGISHSFNGSMCNRVQECDLKEGDKASGDTKQSDECDSDNRVKESATDTHVHCRRCRRPHGMYHGTVIERCRHGVSSEDVNHSLDDIEVTPNISEKSERIDQPHLDSRHDNVSSSSSDALHKMAPLIRCNSSPAPLNLPLTVATPDKDNDSLTVPHTLPISKSGSSRILTNGSLNSNRNAISNDTPSSPNDTCNSAKSRLSMSSSDSGNSSIYTFSGSEKDSTLLRGTKPKDSENAIDEEAEFPAAESDCSNDTFSEYDMQSRDASPCVVSDDYTDFLTKVNANHWFKMDVKRVIRESESSEYESSADLSAFLEWKDGLDSLSLTTVSSMSDLSVLDLEGVPQGHQKHFTRSAANRRRVRFAQVVSSDDSDAKSSNAKSGSSKPENKRYVRRKSAMKNSDKTELYCLPEFSSGVNNDEEEHHTDFDRLERLSCRATAFNPTSIKTGVTVASPPLSPTASLLTRPAVPPRRGQNKLLSDLMKRNHDRQLFAL